MAYSEGFVVSRAGGLGSAAESVAIALRGRQPRAGTIKSAIIRGLPRSAMSVVSSRATRRPEIEVSGIPVRHSLVTSSTMLRMRKRRPQQLELEHLVYRALGTAIVVMAATPRAARLSLALVDWTSTP